MLTIFRSFGADFRRLVLELRSERNWPALVMVVAMAPLLCAAYVVAYLTDW